MLDRTPIVAAALGLAMLATIPACQTPKEAPPPTKGVLTQMTGSAMASQLAVLQPQLESTMASLNQAAAASGLQRATLIQTFNDNSTALRTSVEAMVGEADELRRVGPATYFKGWPATPGMQAAESNAPGSSRAAGDWLFQLDTKSRGFMKNLAAASDELARSPGATTPRLTELLGQLNAESPAMLDTIKSFRSELAKQGFTA
ncbi:MAG: hypothetical protein U0575_00985 [Phycisphaerales bacterium]|jgi:hypothetical protein